MLRRVLRTGMEKAAEAWGCRNKDFVLKPLEGLELWFKQDSLVFPGENRPRRQVARGRG